MCTGICSATCVHLQRNTFLGAPVHIVTFFGSFNCIACLSDVFVCLLCELRALRELSLVALSRIDHVVVNWRNCYDLVLWAE